MSEQKSNVGLYKVLSAILICIVLILIVGIAANGWQKDDINENDNISDGEEDKDNTDTENKNGDTNEDEGTADNNTDSDQTVNTEPEPPKFYSYLSGLECAESISNSIPYAFVIEPNAPLYGVSDAEILIEIPIENGKTRYLMLKNDINELGKLGALAKTRNYISQIVKFFGGILVAHGNDDLVNYTSIPQNLHLDMLENSSYIYKENGKNVYTDADKLKTLTKNLGFDTTTLKTQSMPFNFSDDQAIKGKTSAKCITVPYANGEETVLLYASDGKYSLSKGGRSKVDMLTGENASFTNVFVLFADMVTYEMSDGTETVVKSETDGTGYYLTGGTLTEIRWSVDSSNNLTFTDLSGNKITVNRGNSYIGYYKASESNSVIFE